MQRTLFHELLDGLPVHDEHARRSRRDLRRINACMGNARWWRSLVARSIHAPEHVLELGPGDGTFPLLPGHHVDGIDRLPRPRSWSVNSRWWRMRVQDFTHWGKRDPVGMYETFLADSPLELSISRSNREALERAEAEVEAEIGQAEREALESRELRKPDPATQRRGVFAS